MLLSTRKSTVSSNIPSTEYFLEFFDTFSPGSPNFQHFRIVGRLTLGSREACFCEFGRGFWDEATDEKVRKNNDKVQNLRRRRTKLNFGGNKILRILRVNIISLEERKKKNTCLCYCPSSLSKLVWLVSHSTDKLDVNVRTLRSLPLNTSRICQYIDWQTWIIKPWISEKFENGPLRNEEKEFGNKKKKKKKVFLFHVLPLSKQRRDYFKYPIFHPIYLFLYDNHLFKMASSRVKSKVQAVFHLPRGKSTRSFESESTQRVVSLSLSLSLSLCMKRCWGVRVSKSGTAIFEFGTRECSRFRDRPRSRNRKEHGYGRPV